MRSVRPATNDLIYHPLTVAAVDLYIVIGHPKENAFLLATLLTLQAFSHIFGGGLCEESSAKGFRMSQRKRTACAPGREKAGRLH
jgi:hypothetical protein